LLFGDPKPDLAHPDVPKKDSKADKDDKDKDEEKKTD